MSMTLILDEKKREMACCRMGCRGACYHGVIRDQRPLIRLETIIRSFSDSNNVNCGH